MSAAVRKGTLELRRPRELFSLLRRDQFSASGRSPGSGVLFCSCSWRVREKLSLHEHVHEKRSRVFLLAAPSRGFVDRVLFSCSIPNHEHEHETRFPQWLTYGFRCLHSGGTAPESHRFPYYPLGAPEACGKAYNLAAGVLSSCLFSRFSLSVLTKPARIIYRETIS
jgi:hypothetical protein